jgi:ribosomal protein uL22
MVLRLRAEVGLELPDRRHPNKRDACYMPCLNSTVLLTSFYGQSDSTMVKYSHDIDNAVKAAKAKNTHVRVHFKHCREIGEAIKGRTIAKARAYLENVLAFKEAIPFTKYTGGIGRHAVGKQYKAAGDKVGFPQKATKTFLDLLRNIESNASSPVSLA